MSEKDNGTPRTKGAQGSILRYWRLNLPLRGCYRHFKPLILQENRLKLPLGGKAGDHIDGAEPQRYGFLVQNRIIGTQSKHTYIHLLIIYIIIHAL